MAMRKRRPNPPSDRLNPHARRRAVEGFVERNRAKTRFYPGEDIPRGTVLYATVDINLPGERGVRPDGSDRHPVKTRSVAVWTTRPTGDLEAVALSANLLPIEMATTPAHDKTLTADPVLGRHMAFLHRLVLVPVSAIDWTGRSGELSPGDLRRLEHLVDTGVVADLTDRPPAGLVGIGRRDPAAADQALAELRQRRQRIIASLEDPRTGLA